LARSCSCHGVVPLVRKLASVEGFSCVSPSEDARQSERAQIRLAAQGDAQAARAIVTQHRAGMRALALRVIGDGAEAEDLVQEAFARAFKRLHQFDDKYRLSTWLYRIVLNSCRDHLKSPRRKECPSALQEAMFSRGTDPSADPWVVRDRAHRLHRALAELQPSYKQILVLKDLMELSYDEIHTITGTPITGLKIRAIRARARMRELLEAGS
jgi:RNA polymerase sigma-70 factor, ECF subfamily